MGRHAEHSAEQRQDREWWNGVSNGWLAEARGLAGDLEDQQDFGQWMETQGS